MKAPRLVPILTVVLVATSPMHAAPAPAITDESKVPPYTLPDPLVCADGTVVRDAATWTAKRRPELLELFAVHEYGSLSKSHRC